jgi:hypothetical protein
MKTLLAASVLTFGLLLGCATPLTGNYDIVVGRTESDCSDEFDTLAPPEGLQGVTISTSAGTMTLAGDPDEVCDLDEDFQFVCTFAGADTEVDYTPQHDAVVLIDLGMRGEWTANDAFEGVTSVDLTCDGADCDAIVEAGAADCSIEWEFTAERD